MEEVLSSSLSSSQLSAQQLQSTSPGRGSSSITTPQQQKREERRLAANTGGGTGGGGRPHSSFPSHLSLVACSGRLFQVTLLTKLSLITVTLHKTEYGIIQKPWKHNILIYPSINKTYLRFQHPCTSDNQHTKKWADATESSQSRINVTTP